MLFAACATTSPTTDSVRKSQLMLTEPVSRASPTASSPPMIPEVAVMLNTAARVMTSHLLIASGGRVMPSGRFAVLITVRQTAKRWPRVR